MQKKRKGDRPLSLQDRRIVEVRWCKDGKRVTDMAEELKRDKSSVSREIGGKPRRGRGGYHADSAHGEALERIVQWGNKPKKARRF